MSADLAAAALSLVGAAFRLHGRTEATGLDCVGVVEAALARTGRHVRLPNGYPLRRRDVPDLGAITGPLGLNPVPPGLQGEILPGDVLMLRVSPCQLHLAIAADPGTIVHAHAALRKVVLGPLPAGWARAGHWRLSSQ